VWAGTFHGFSAWCLRRHGAGIGIDPSFTILDRDDQERLVKGILADLGLAAWRSRPEVVVSAISYFKSGGGGRPPLDLRAPDTAAEFDRIRGAYAERLAAGRLLDFDDLLLETRRLLAEDADAADALRARFAEVLVDEYQDTNGVQRELLLNLCRSSGRISVVGDPDQSIYRWRGAQVGNILRFAEDFPGARTILLEQNYRSSARILAAAEGVIARNRERFEKRLFTANPDGEAVVVKTFASGAEEADAVARALLAWRREGGSLDEAAVFYRVNAFSRGLELALRTHAVPYAIVAGVEFFQRREVKDLLAYARLLTNPRDEAAFFRVLNVPRRGVGDRSVEVIRRAARERGLSAPEAAAGATGLPAAAARGLAEFLALLAELRARPPAPVGPLLKEIVERTGYRESLVDPRDQVGIGRAENVDELLTFAHEFDAAEGGAGLPEFVERTSLVSDQDGWVGAGGRASLMSVHAAKGLEFDFVVVAGAENGAFPHLRNAEDRAAEEEERRLFYVALTRARRRLWITSAGWRMGWRGVGEARFPSPYLRDIPPGAADRRQVAPSEPADEASFLREESLPYGVGDRVRHPHFGVGVLLDTEGSGPGLRVTVDFESFGRKQMLATYARLERVS
jgi:DNA helicase-2/ATP-dependent DNA helicase PcrA